MYAMYFDHIHLHSIPPTPPNHHILLMSYLFIYLLFFLQPIVFNETVYMVSPRLSTAALVTYQDPHTKESFLLTPKPKPTYPPAPSVEL